MCIRDRGYAAGGETDFSSTNVRTEGVDEGDIVKTDGSYIYTLTGSGTLRIVSADGGSLSVVGQTSLDDLTSVPYTHLDVYKRQEKRWRPWTVISA